MTIDDLLPYYTGEGNLETTKIRQFKTVISLETVSLRKTTKITKVYVAKTVEEVLKHLSYDLK